MTRNNKYVILKLSYLSLTLEAKMKTKKKESVFKQIGKYMGKSRLLMPVSLIFSALSTALTIMPMIFIWLVLRDLLGNNPEKQTLSYQSTNLTVIGVTAILGIITYFIS